MISELDKFLIIAGLASTAAFLKYAQRRWPEIKHQANYLEWVMILLIPVAVAPSAFKETGIHPYWNYLVYSISSTILIGIGIWNGYHSEEGWTPNYKATFASICFSLIVIGIGIHLLMSVVPYEAYFEAR